MLSREEAQKKFHEVDNKLQALRKEFAEFCVEATGNIDSNEADQFRNNILKLEKKAESYFNQYACTKTK